jgi:hypothetical protein
MLNPTRDVLTNKYTCSICHYSCIKNSDFTKHLNTNKHNAHKCSFNAHKTDIFTCECGKTYKHIQSYNRHKKICGDDSHNILGDTPTNVKPIKSAPLQVDDHLQMNLILELVKQNQEFKQLLIEQTSTILEVAKSTQTNNINNTISHSNNNSHNKTFNLNFFLNETCKDAMNMKDFIKSLELTLPELEKMGEIGFAEGMSRLFVDRLNKLDITKRPIHCSDVKREIIHIKDDNKWERDNANLDRLRKIIKQLTIKNILRVDDWKKANAGCTEYNSRKNGQYLKIHMQALGPVDDDEVKRDFGKIIRRVAETTAIDKTYLS